MTESTAHPAPPGEQRLSQVVKVLTEVASLVALATALLYYFGWRRSEAQARAFGADASVFGMSTPDYVLRSIDVVLLPAVLLLLVGLLAVWLHRRLVSGRHAGSVASVMRFSWLLPLVIGVPLLVLWEPVGILSFPFWFALAVLGTWYGIWLRRISTADPSTTSLPVLLLLGTLVAVSLFWMTERVARVGGEARADAIKADVNVALDAVSVYSEKRLQLDGSDVAETELTDPEAAYRYRYDGLFLLQQSGGKYFLLTADWSPGNGRLVALPDDDSIRLEFGPGR
jgi:hypothetical protein